MPKKFITFFICLIFLLYSNLTSLRIFAAQNSLTVKDGFENLEVSGEEINKTKSYFEYLENMDEKIVSENPVKIMYNQFSEAEGKFTIQDDSIYMEEEGFLSFDFQCAPGIYNLIIEYDPDPGRSRDIELACRLNGKLPFREAGNLHLTRRWRDEVDVFATDVNDNDIRPSQEEITIEERGWLSYIATDSSGFHIDPFLFQLEKGNTLSIYVSRENIFIKSITFIPFSSPLIYNEYAEKYKEILDSDISLPIIQAEIPAWKNNATLVASADRISPATIPNKGAKISLNMIGGQIWSTPGEEIAWGFTPEKTGMYEIRFRLRQNHTRGFYSTRSLKINGKSPFAEADNLQFPYERGWEIFTVSVDEIPCKFYFEKGKKYDLSLTVTLGDFGEVLGRTQETVSILNDIYRELIMIMGATPDIMRDYNLDKQIPDTIAEMKKQADNLEDILKHIKKIAGFTGSELATLKKVSDQLLEFRKDPREIAKRLNYFKDNIAALNTWMINAMNLPLDIDYISIAAPGSEVPKGDAGFFQMASYMVQMFFSSFFEDYNLLAGTSDDSDTEITVWSTTGRDQATILNDMIRSNYTPNSKKTVRIKLQVIQPDAILPSVAAKNGPDVLMNAGMQIPVNYATRKAAINLYDIVGAEELEQVLSRFRQTALTPLRFNGGIYGLPEQETYSMMFYRTDILSELNIPEPTSENPWTWDDVIKYLPILQKKNMTFLMDTGTSVGAETNVGMTTYAMFVIQRGGQFYKEDGVATDLDSEIAVEAFKYWTRFYTSYGLPTNFNIANRFRTGVSPVVIANMIMYNQLMVSAPEIKGLWKMSLVPGTKKEDGSIDHSVRSTISSIMILHGKGDKSASWDYLKWWTDTDTQVMFSREMESLMGTSARYPTANIEAMSLLPWSMRDYRVLNEQAKWAKGIPEVPGGYYTPRHINNAFRAVCIKSSGDEPRETILNYAKVINDEIFDKRTEFGLPTVR